MSRENTQPAEFPDDAEIDGGANYDHEDIFAVENPDPGMRYFFSVDDGDGARPDGVSGLERRGYARSTKRHHHPDAKTVLMEIPRSTHEARQRAAEKQNVRNMHDAMRPPANLEVLSERHGIEKRKK